MFKKVKKRYKKSKRYLKYNKRRRKQKIKGRGKNKNKNKVVKRKKRRTTIKIYKRIIKSLSVFIESKQVKSRHSTIIIPFPITKNRSTFLIAKWLFLAVKQNKNQVSLEKKLIREVGRLVKKKRSAAFYFKLQNIKLAIKNRSYIHYRW